MGAYSTLRCPFSGITVLPDLPPSTIFLKMLAIVMGSRADSASFFYGDFSPLLDLNTLTSTYINLGGLSFYIADVQCEDQCYCRLLFRFEILVEFDGKVESGDRNRRTGTEQESCIYFTLSQRK